MDGYPGIDVQDSYEIQFENIRRRTSEGRIVVGYKVGLTAKATQQLLGIDEPDYGHLLDDMVHADGTEVSIDRFCAPRIEAEIAFRLRAPLTGPGVTVADVLAVTDSVTAALEVVDSRIADWKVTLADTVADNASAAAAVLGTNWTPITKAPPLPDIGCDGSRPTTGRSLRGCPYGRPRRAIRTRPGVPARDSDLPDNRQFPGWDQERGNMSNEDIRDELAALRAEVADLRSALADQENGTVSDARASTVGRRAALGAAGAAIVGAVVGTSASPAAAAAGSFNTGQENTATGATYLVQEEPAVSSNVLQASDRSVPLSAFPSSIGAYAYKENRNGLYAFASSNGFGLVGWGLGGTARGAHLRGTAAPLNIRSEGAAPVERDTPTPGSRSEPLVGDVIFDTNRDLWLCVEVPSEGPAIYRRLAGENTTGGLRLNLPNTRAFDSRSGQEPLDVSKGKISGTFTGSIDLFNGVEGAEIMRAALINITVTNTEASGYVQVWNSDGTRPATSSINWPSAGTTIANTTVVPTSVDGKVRVFVSGRTHLIIDLIGWFV